MNSKAYKTVHRAEDRTSPEFIQAQRDLTITLSPRAYQLHSLMMTYKDGWQFYQKHIAEQLGITTRYLQKFINELKEHGLLEFRRFRNSMKAKDGSYVLYELPKQLMKTLAAKARAKAKEVVNQVKGAFKRKPVSREQLFNECINRISKNNEIHPEDFEYLKMTFNDWFDSLTKPPRPQAAYQWLLVAYKKNLTVMRSLSKIQNAKDVKADATVDQILMEASARRYSRDRQQFSDSMTNEFPEQTSQDKCNNIGLIYDDEATQNEGLTGGVDPEHYGEVLHGEADEVTDQ